MHEKYFFMLNNKCGNKPQLETKAQIIDLFGITSQRHCFQLSDTLNDMDFKFYPHKLCTKM